MIFVFCLRGKQTKNEKKPFFLNWTALGCSLLRKEGISLIYLHSSSWKERGVYASFPEIRKYLQTENSGTPSQKSMKLGLDMYHLNIFHFQKTGRGNWWAGHEIHQLSTLTSRKNILKNAMKVGFFWLSSLTIWL